MMKRMFNWLPAVTLATLLASGCGSDSSDSPPSSTATAEMEPSANAADPEERQEAAESSNQTNQEPERAQPRTPSDPPLRIAENSAANNNGEIDGDEAAKGKPQSDKKTADENGTTDKGLAAVLNLRREGKFSQALQELRKLKNQRKSSGERRQLQELEVELRRLQRDAVGLDRAIDNLVSSNPSVRSFARRKLRGGTSAGAILLRKAVRDAAPPVAEEAAQLLVEQNDEKWMDSALERVIREPGAEIADDLVQLAEEEGAWESKAHINQIADFALTAFRRSGEPMLPDGILELLNANTAKIDAEFWPQAYEVVVSAQMNDATPLIPLLDKAYEQLSNEDDKRFGELVGDAEAVPTLKDRVLKLIQSGTGELPDWIREDTAFVPLIRGLHGHYYRGPSDDRFNELAEEHIDPKIELALPEFPQGKSNFACRWTGFVAIPEEGKYTFTSASDDGQRMWVNEQLIIDDWNYHGVKSVSGTIELTAGLHPIRVEHFQGEGGAAITVYWEGPNFDKTVLAGDALWTYPIPAKSAE